MSPGRLFVIALSLLLFPLVARAARPATIDLDVVEVREGPSEKYKILFTLQKGVALAAANVPIEGYYKVRAADGRIGWVPADTLVFVDPNVPQAPGRPDVMGDQPPIKKLEDTSKRRKWFGLRLIGGYSIFAPAELNALLAQTILENGFNAGLEIGVLFSERFSAWIRAERLFQLAYAVPESGGNAYQWDLSSWPVMAGVEFKIWSNRHFLVNLGVLGGAGFATNFSSTALASAAPNTTTYFGTAFGGLARAGFSWTPAHWFLIGLEGGYRFLRTLPASPAVLGEGGEILQVNGQYPSVAIDMSGPFFELVLGLQL